MIEEVRNSPNYREYVKEYQGYRFTISIFNDSWVEIAFRDVGVAETHATFGGLLHHFGSEFKTCQKYIELLLKSSHYPVPNPHKRSQ